MKRPSLLRIVELRSCVVLWVDDSVYALFFLMLTLGDHESHVVCGKTSATACAPEYGTVVSSHQLYLPRIRNAIMFHVSLSKPSVFSDFFHRADGSFAADNRASCDL